MQFAFPGWSESKEEEIKHPPKRQRHRQEKKGSPQSSQSVSNFNSRPRPIILSEQGKNQTHGVKFHFAVWKKKGNDRERERCQSRHDRASEATRGRCRLDIYLKKKKKINKNEGKKILRKNR